MCSTLVVISVLIAPSLCYQQWQTLYLKITKDPEFSGFNTMLKNNRIAELNLMYSGITLFVPENKAVGDFDGDFTSNLVLYHMGVDARTFKMLAANTSVETASVDNPPLWITLANGGYYVNDAKIIESRSNYLAKSHGDATKNQVLHVIDRVLDPMMFTPYPNATALDFLEHYNKWDIDRWKVSNFLTRIQFYNKEDFFKRKGGHTFLIPVDQKMDDYRFRSIDSYIIDGHVIPNSVLFTRPTEKQFIFETEANGDYIYIVVSFITAADKLYVKSYTVLGDSDHKKGEIFSEVLKANIPVANGVVHLISRPLAVFERDFKPFPYLTTHYKLVSDPYLNLTYHLAVKTNIANVVKYPLSALTLFAPSNSAWEKGFLTYSEDELKVILGRHVIVSNRSLSLPQLAMVANKNNGVTLTTLSGPVKLDVHNLNDTYFLTWNHKNIKVSRLDYECSDGVVHIIEDVFGEPDPNPPTPTEAFNFWKLLKQLVT